MSTLTLTTTVVGTVNTIKVGGAISTTIAQTVIDVGGDRAQDEARRVLGTTRYDELVDAGSGDDYDALHENVARLAFFYAMPLLNLRLTEKGGFLRSTGLVENQTDVMSKSELEAYRGTVYEMAMNGLQTLQASAGDKPYLSSPSQSDVVYAL